MNIMYNSDYIVLMCRYALNRLFVFLNSALLSQKGGLTTINVSSVLQMSRIVTEFMTPTFLFILVKTNENHHNPFTKKG